MEPFYIMSLEDLNEAIINAVNAAFDARDKGEDTTTLISREAAAQILGVDLSTLWRWDRDGYFKPFTRIGRAVWYREKDIRDFKEGKINGY